MTRRGFFGAIAAALGCARAPVWKRDPLRCAWHDGAGGVITDQELVERGLRWCRCAPGCQQLRRTYTESQYSRSIRFG